MIRSKMSTLKLSFFFLTLTFSISCIAQTNQLDSLINDDLQRIIIDKQKYYNAVWEGNKTIANDYCIFTNNYYRNFEYSNEVISTGIKFIFPGNLTKQQKKQGVYGVAFSGVKLENNKLQLIFVDQGYKLEGKKLICGLADGYSFYYEYSCDLKQWILKETSPTELFMIKTK